MKQHYDILIIGGGMVGASLAASLIPAGKRLGLSIAVVEAFPMTDAGSVEYQPSYDARATALAYGSRLIYEQIGIWEQLCEHLSPITDIHVSDKGRFGVSRLNAGEENVAALGYVVENHWLGRVLMNRLAQPDAAHIDLLCPAEVTAVSYQQQNMAVTLSAGGSEHSLTAELVVMADGGRSGLREQLGIGYQQQGYHQHALVTNISPETSHHHIAYERFTDTGPMALLPLEDLPADSASGQTGVRHRMGLVWTVPDDQIEELMALNDRAFIERVHERFGYRAGVFVKVGERYSYPLKLSVADEQVRQGLIVLGNAAHALHPIAGQGYNLALRGVVSLAAELIRAREAGIGLGDVNHLTRFARQVRQDQQKTIGFSDKTMKLFSNSNPLLALGRSAGLQLLDICPLAKTVFARSAMGLDQPTPDLR
ncbi:2-octaprenyl-6-methoxyphenol hydroxylase [Amphritea atlantica]|uniref:2-octaprenyl-6-methoxyphenol hydroxylase n=1 Tax=Amphritea atlantica TaxID=355243 RepID=A0A1H9K2P7_9GAMM|nr:2-octaprenyl-6-methoxyphenyl hydroxylase [Amphritea atlantica]SEQ93384.1 2-octaprenyl-6-methoxyphenol hydroxylase [Amphritea atlantica]